MIEMIEKDIPVITSITPSDSVDLFNVNPDGTVGAFSEEVKSHFVSTTGIVIDTISGKTLLKISSWGSEYYLDYDQFISNGDYFSGIINVEK